MPIVQEPEPSAKRPRFALPRRKREPRLYLTVSVLFFLALAWRAPLNQHNIVITPGGVAFGTGAGISPRPSRVRRRSTTLTSGRCRPPGGNSPLLGTMIPHLFKAKQSPQTFVSTLLGDILKMMFFLLPLFAVSLKLLYLWTKRLYVEHLIFLLHVDAFMFLLLTTLLLVPTAWRLPFAGLALAVYVAVALRAVYTQGWPKTLTKFVLLGLGYIVLLALCFADTTLVALWLL